jgi:hypothetical protein
MPIAVDRQKMIRTVQARLDQTESERERHNLEVLLTHMEGEVNADIDKLISTVTPECEYRTYGAPPELNPKGHDAVREFYEARAASGQLYFEFDIEHLVVDDDAILTEGVMIMITPSKTLTEYGVEDDGTYYKMVARMAIVWPFAPDGLLRGEDSFSSVISFDKLALEDVPEDVPAAA